MQKETIGILVGPKGRGTNMRAIIAACASGQVPATVVAVVSPHTGTPATDFAISESVPVRVVPPGEEYEDRLCRALADCSLVCLAGYMRLLPVRVLAEHPGRVLNIHPALLPKFGGRGMFGFRVHEAVIKAGETESGCTVHQVTPLYDEGEILIQKRLQIEPGEVPEQLAAKVLELEGPAYIEAIQKVICGKAA